MRRGPQFLMRVGLVLGVALLLGAEPAAPRKPLGGWERKAGDNTVKFQFAADHLTLDIQGGATRIALTGDYGVTQDGTLFGIITKVEKDGSDTPNVGDLFSFKIAFDKDKLTLSELKPDGDEARALLQGDFKRLPEKK